MVSPSLDSGEIRLYNVPTSSAIKKQKEMPIMAKSFCFDESLNAAMIGKLRRKMSLESEAMSSDKSLILIKVGYGLQLVFGLVCG